MLLVSFPCSLTSDLVSHSIFLALIVAMSAFDGDFILNLSSTLVLLLENVVFMEDAHNLIGYCL